MLDMIIKTLSTAYGIDGQKINGWIDEFRQMANKYLAVQQSTNDRLARIERALNITEENENG